MRSDVAEVHSSKQAQKPEQHGYDDHCIDDRLVGG